MGKERKTKTVDGHNDPSDSMRRGTRYSADDPGLNLAALLCK